MPNSRGRRRRFGAVRELRSGQWQARYRGPDGIMRPDDRTFPDKTAAEVWLTRKEAEILNGDWLDPTRAASPLASRRKRGSTSGPACGPSPFSSIATCCAVTWPPAWEPHRQPTSASRRCAAGVRSG